MLKKLFLVVVTAALATASRCFAEDLDKVYGSNGAQDVIEAATEVKAYRLVSDSYYRGKVSDYKAVGEPRTVTPEIAKQTAELLLGPKNYSWEIAKGCEPIYGVRLEFVSGGKRTDVLFCFSCDILTGYYQGKVVGSEDFDTMRPQLAALMKQIFPKDKVIQELDKE
jgi:hypothetical protein